MQIGRMVMTVSRKMKGLASHCKAKTTLLLMLEKALDNVKIEKWKVKVVSALQKLASPFTK